MPTSDNTTGRRKVHCPKCTAVLTEPSASVYECPICSTLLLARGSSAGLKGGLLESSLHGSLNDANNNETGKRQEQLGMGHAEQEIKLLEKNMGVLRSDFFDKIKSNVWQEVLPCMVDDQPLAGNKYHSPRKSPRDGLVSRSNAFHLEMPLYPSQRRPSYSSTASGESLDKSEQGRHFSGIRSASFTGSEAGFHSPPWSSSENVEMSEVGSSIGQTEGSSLNESCNAHMSNLGMVCSDPMVGESGGATHQKEVDHAERHCVKLWSGGGVTDEEAFYVNVGLDTRVEDEEAKSGINKDSFADLAHTWSDSDDNDRLCSRFTELSFRIEPSVVLSPSLSDQDALEMAVSKQGSLSGPNADMLRNDSEGMTSCRSNNSERNGEVSNSKTSCNNEISLKEALQNADARDSNSSDQDAEGDDKNQENEGLWNLNVKVWRPEGGLIGRDSTTRCHMPSEGFDCVDSDCVDEELTLKAVDLRNSSCENLAFSTFSKEDFELSGNCLLQRESQGQDFSSRNNYESSNANPKSGNDDGSERPITPLRETSLQKFYQRNQGETAQTEVDEGAIDFKTYLYEGACGTEGFPLSQRREHGDTYAYQKVLESEAYMYESPYLEEQEPHLISTLGRRRYLVDDRSVSPRIPRRQDDEGNDFAYQREYVDPHRAALNRDTIGRFSILNSCNQLDSPHANKKGHTSLRQGHTFEAEGNVRERGSGYSFHDPAAHHYHYHARSKELESHFHPSEQYLVDSSCLPLLWSNRVYPSQMACHNFMAPGPSCQKDSSHFAALNSASPACTFCKQESCMKPQPNMPQHPMHHPCAVCFSQQPSKAHQHVLLEPRAYHVEPTMYGKCPAKQSQTGCHLLQSQGQIRSTAHLEYSAFLARKQKRYPPLPGPGAAPYVLCQGCYKMLQVPRHLPVVSAVQKLRCGECRKTSKFCVSLPADNRSNIKEGVVTNAAHVSYPDCFSNTNKSHLAAATVHPSEHSSSYFGRQGPISTLGLGGAARFGSSLHPQCERLDNQALTHPTTRAMTELDAEKLDSVCHPRPITTILQGQGLFESQWRYGEGDRLLNSSGLFNEGYLSSSSSSAFGSSPIRNAADHCAHDHQKLEAVRNDRVGFGEKKMSHGFLSQSAVLGQDGKGFEAPSFADGFFQKGSSDSRIRASPGEVQGSIDADLFKSSSRNSNQKLPVTPGSPLIEHFTADPAGFDSSLQQGHLTMASSKNGISSVALSPAPGSPLYEHLSYDAASDFEECVYQKENNAGEREVGRGPKYLASLLKKSLREFGKGGQGNNNGQVVVVNGHMIPDAAIKRAEEKAGRVHPGVYWYDYQAGFWGIIGGPCLGIIPPFIEEFKFPIAKDCAGGRTGVLVNGRELHKKDLDVLASRGLPTTSGKAYMVDISGQVVDTASGRQLKSLGRLAPTIERRGRGCGMLQPTVQSSFPTRQ